MGERISSHTIVDITRIREEAQGVIEPLSKIRRKKEKKKEKEERRRRKRKKEREEKERERERRSRGAEERWLRR